MRNRKRHPIWQAWVLWVVLSCFVLVSCEEQKTPTPEDRLRQARRNAQRTTRRAAAIVLGQMRGAAASAVPALQRACKHPRWRVRMHAVRALGKIGARPAATVPVLLKALEDKEMLVVESARFALAQLGSASLPGLKTLSRSSSKTLRVLAARTLEEMVKKHPAGVALLVPLLKDPSPAVRAATGKALSRAQKSALLPHLPQLLGALVHRQADVSYAVADALRQTDSAAEPQLLAGLASPSRIRRRFSAIVLGNVGRNPQKVVPALKKALRKASKEMKLHLSAKASQPYNETTSLVEALAEALGGFGDKAASSVELLLALAADPSVQVRRSAIRALGNIGPRAASAVSALQTRVLKDRTLEVRRESIEALGKIGPLAAAAVPALIHTLRTDPRSRNVVREALARIGSAAVPALLKILESTSNP